MRTCNMRRNLCVAQAEWGHRCGTSASKAPLSSHAAPGPPLGPFRPPSKKYKLDEKGFPLPAPPSLKRKRSTTSFAEIPLRACLAKSGHPYRKGRHITCPDTSFHSIQSGRAERGIPFAGHPACPLPPCSGAAPPSASAASSAAPASPGSPGGLRPMQSTSRPPSTLHGSASALVAHGRAPKRRRTQGTTRGDASALEAIQRLREARQHPL